MISWYSKVSIQVVPGRAGGGSFKRKKNHIAEKEFAYRMCARRPTIAMSNFFWGVWTKLLPLHGCDVMRIGVMCLWFDLLSSDVASCDVICGTAPVLLCTTKNYNVLLQRTTLYYKELQRTTPTYYSVLQSTTPALLCTTKYYASTTLYYTVLRQYYSVLQSTTPVLLCTTKYYSSTSLYYKVLRQYYSVLHQYYNVLLRYYIETSFTMRGATRVTVQLHQILRLPRKMNVINDLRHIWNVISNAWSK